MASRESVVTFHISDGSRKNLTIFLKIRDIPEGFAGIYRVRDGHECVLVEDEHGLRLRNLGESIKSLLRSGATRLILRFDRTLRELGVQADMSSSNDGIGIQI